KQDVAFRCLDGHVHDFYHVTPQSKCVTTSDGSLAVDFVVTYEHLEDDFKELISILNGRREPSVPVIEHTLGWHQKGPLVRESRREADAESGQPDSRHSSPHVQKYFACGSDCIRSVARYYGDDFDAFGYPKCGSRP
ncbi:unnamed protein product, partial [Ostreobium quekettii]